MAPDRFALVLALVASLMALLAASAWGAPTLDDVLDAIRAVESSGGRDTRDGDDGRAIGPYQIWRCYWTDAAEFDRSLGGRYEDCRNDAYARRVVVAYWRRHERSALGRVDAEALARCHKGGPGWRQKPETMGYWRRVRECMANGS